MSNLKPCPCGKIPKDLFIQNIGQGNKYLAVSGTCCGNWMVEFRGNYYSPDTDECKMLSIDAWNSA